MEQIKQIVAEIEALENVNNLDAKIAVKIKLIALLNLIAGKLAEK